MPASIEPLPKKSRLVMTDWESPPGDSEAGLALAQSMLRLNSACSLAGEVRSPMQGISALQIPADLMKDALMIIAGSPANHLPDCQSRSSTDSHASNRKFKEEAFYSLMWATASNQGIFMTYSTSACGRLEFWHDKYDGRILVSAPAHFATYKPRKGFANSLEPLADDIDCQVGAYIPVEWMPSSSGQMKRST